MFLQYYLNEQGDRVYTLKVRRKKKQKRVVNGHGEKRTWEERLRPATELPRSLTLWDNRPARRILLGSPQMTNTLDTESPSRNASRCS